MAKIPLKELVKLSLSFKASLRYSLTNVNVLPLPAEDL
jgi:hypothetical protein